MPVPSKLDRFRGCLLGLAVGDALGFSVRRHAQADAIYYSFGFGRNIVTKPPVDSLTYTDDTPDDDRRRQGTAGRRMDTTKMRWPWRLRRISKSDAGMARAHRRIIETMIAGGDWCHLSRTIFPGGSLGNGQAMRVAPVGLCFRDDLDRVWEWAGRSATPTHSHPVGIEGVQFLAVAVLRWRIGRVRSTRNSFMKS